MQHQPCFPSRVINKTHLFLLLFVCFYAIHATQCIGAFATSYVFVFPSLAACCRVAGAINGAAAATRADKHVHPINTMQIT